VGGRGIGIGIGNIDSKDVICTHTHRWQRVKDNTKYSDVITDEKNPLASESKYFRGRGGGKCSANGRRQKKALRCFFVRMALSRSLISAEKSMKREA
jgi:hypothetical protein